MPNRVGNPLNMLFDRCCFNLTESQPKLSRGDPNHVGFYDLGVGDHSAVAQGAKQILTFLMYIRNIEYLAGPTYFLLP